MTTLKTFLIVSLPHVEEEKVYKLEIEYVLLSVELSSKEETLLRTCLEEPFRASDDTRGGGSELLFGQYLVTKQKNDVKWETLLLKERKTKSFMLHEIDNKKDLQKWWRRMPHHDVCLIAQIVRECSDDSFVDWFEHLKVCKSQIERKKEKLKDGQTLTQFEKDVLELTEEDFEILSDDSSLSTINEDEKI